MQSLRDDKWHVCRSLIRLALEYDSNCIARWNEGGRTVLYTTMSREEKVMGHFTQIGLLQVYGVACRCILLHDDLDSAADALRTDIDFECVLSALVAETCDNNLISAGQEPFELKFHPRTAPEVCIEIHNLMRHLVALDCIALLASDDGRPLYQWSTRMTAAMHDNYNWGGAPQYD